LRLRLGSGDGGVYGRAGPYDFARASTPRTNSSRLGSRTRDLPLEPSKRAIPGRGEQSLEMLGNGADDPVSICFGTSL
jgi:hypothetical protein